MAFLILQLQKDHVFLKLNLLQVFYSSWRKPSFKNKHQNLLLLLKRMGCDWGHGLSYLLAFTNTFIFSRFFPFYEYFTLICFLSYHYVSSFPNVLPLSPSFSSSRDSLHQQARFWFNSFVVDTLVKHLRNYQANGAKGLLKDLLPRRFFVSYKQIQ